MAVRRQADNGVDGKGQYVLAYTPFAYLLDKSRDVANGHGAEIREWSPYVDTMLFPAGGWESYLETLAAGSTAHERRELWLALIDRPPTEVAEVARQVFASRTAEQWCAHALFGWVDDLLDQDSVFSYFQPIVDVEDGTVHGYEALLRARDIAGNIVTAQRLLEAARELGVAFKLDQRGRQAALKGAQAMGLGGARLFINFLPTAVLDREYGLDTTIRALEQTDFSPEDIVFEVVESDRIANQKDLVRILNRYRTRGFKIAMDDLGDGYATLNFLSALRPDYIKLDMEIVRNAPNDLFRACLIEAFASLADDCRVHLIAEGVEHLHTARYLRDCGVRLIQGYLLARPAEVPTIDAAALDALRSSPAIDKPSLAQVEAHVALEQLAAKAPRTP